MKNSTTWVRAADGRFLDPVREPALDRAIVSAAGSQPEEPDQSGVGDAYYDRLRQTAREMAERNPTSAPAEDVAAEAVAKLGKSRVDEIIGYATAQKQDIAGTLRAELDFVAAHPRVEALPIKKTARVASSRHSR